MSQSRRLGWMVLVLFLAGPLLFTPRTLARVDFGDLESSPGEESLRPVEPSRRIISSQNTIWSGEAEHLQFETGVLGERLLWVLADQNRLYISLGQEKVRRLLQGDVTRSIRGTLVTLDVHSLPAQPDRMLVSVVSKVHRQLGDKMFSTIYLLEIRDRRLQLREYTQKVDRALRPVGDLMYSQGFTGESFWKSEIYRMRSTQNGFELGTLEPRPDGSRLLSSTYLRNSLWAQILSHGDLILSHNNQELDRLEGDFGIRNLDVTVRYKHTKKEPVRIPPAYSPEQRVLAVVENPPPKGVLGWFSSTTDRSYIRLFSLQDERLTSLALLGPSTNPVIDLEIPEANSSQLLWLEKSATNKVILKMIDLTEHL